MNLLDTIRAEWAFVDLDGVEIIEINAFGNVLVRDRGVLAHLSRGALLQTRRFID